jgi:hypothetical protein
VDNKQHGRFKRVRLKGALIGLLAVTACSAPVAAKVTAATHNIATSSVTRTTCTTAERNQTLAYEQKRVLSLVGKFRVLRNPEDVAELALPTMQGGIYEMLPHMYDSMKGMGFTIVDIGGDGKLRPGIPTFLLYRPNPADKDVTNPAKPDFPYTLVGWGYSVSYTPGTTPSFGDDPGLRCIEPSQWVVHERGVHPADTWEYIPVPPQESYHGQSAGQTLPTSAQCHCPVGMPHPRLWDLHIFLTGKSVPQVSLLNPGRPIPGFNPEVGIGFFYPKSPPTKK